MRGLPVELLAPQLSFSCGLFGDVFVVGFSHLRVGVVWNRVHDDVAPDMHTCMKLEVAHSCSFLSVDNQLDLREVARDVPLIQNHIPF